MTADATRSGGSDISCATSSTAPSSIENNMEERSVTSTCSAVEKKKELVVVPGSGRAGDTLQVAFVPTGGRRQLRRRPKEEPWVPPAQEERPMTPTATHSSYSCPNEPNSPPWTQTLARSQSTPASPRDIVSESRNAWRVTTSSNLVVSNTDKKVFGSSLWERNAGGDWGILEASSPASSLSSNPFPTEWAYYNSNAQEIFRSLPRDLAPRCECERCQLHQNLMQRETLCIVPNMSSSMSTLTPDDLLVMDCQCSKCYAAMQQRQPNEQQPLESLVLIHRSPSTDESLSTLTADVVDRAADRPAVSDTQHLEKSSKSKRLLEAVGILLDVFAPNCCAIKPSRPGVLQPWHLLLPTAQAKSSNSSVAQPPQSHDNISVMRLRGCYL